MGLLFSVFEHYYTLWIVMLGTACVGVVAGGVGVFALLRRQSLLGDAISHAALPGIALMFLVTHSTNSFVLLAGGALAGCLGATLVAFLDSWIPLKRDALLGIVLAVFFGLGIVIKSVIQKKAIVGQALLGKFFFGNAATLVSRDVLILFFIAIFLFGLLALFWKEFTLIAFDADFARTQGYSVLIWDIFLTLIIVCAIVMGLHAVGVLLMSALLVAPAAAARQWCTSVASLFWLAVFFGGVASLAGSLVSSLVFHLPTGPMIVVFISIIVIISLLGAPGRGVLRRK